MNWETFHRRGDVLQAVIREADARCDGELPMYVPGAERVFSDERDLLAALSLKWHTNLQGMLEKVYNDQPLDFEAAVVGAWRELATDLPGIRRVLDKALESDEEEIVAMLEKSQAKERELLALWSGRVSAFQIDEFGAKVGAEVEAVARKGFEIPTSKVAPPAPTLFERLKAGTRSKTSAIA